MSILGTPSRLIRRHGRQIAYSRAATSSYNPATSTYSKGAPVNETPYAYPSRLSFSDSQAPNIIGKEAVTYSIPASELSVRPKSGDIITDGSLKYTVQVVHQIDSLGVPNLYKVVCIRA